MQVEQADSDVLRLPAKRDEKVYQRVRLGCGAIGVAAAAALIYHEAVPYFGATRKHIDANTLIIGLLVLAIHYAGAWWQSKRPLSAKHAQMLEMSKNPVWQIDDTGVMTPYGRYLMPTSSITGYRFMPINPTLGFARLLLLCDVPQRHYRKLPIRFDQALTSKDDVRAWMRRHDIAEIAYG